MKSFSKKTWRRILRIAIVIAGIYLLFMIGLSIYISSSKERLLTFLSERMKETIIGELKIDKADITVWQTFPKIGIKLTNVTISDSFYHRPFLNAKQIIGKVGLLDVLGMKVKVSSIEINDAVIHTFTEKNGYTNSYVLKPQNKPKRKGKKPVVISNLELNNVIAISENAIKQKRFEIRIREADADINLNAGKYFIDLDEDIFVRGLGFNLPKGYWLENQRIQAEWKLQFDTAGSILSFNDTKVKIQEQPFIMKGAFYMNAPATHFRIEASTKNISYANAMALLKPTTSAKIKKINFSKGLNVKLVLDGPLAYKTIPLVKVDFSTADNNLTTPVINFNNCSFTGNFINQVNSALPRTDDNSRVTINSFVSKWGDIELKAQHIAVTNLLHPILQFEFYSQCTLPQLDEQLSSSTLRFINGNAKLYLAYNGALIADASLLDQLNAKIRINNGKIVYIPRNLTFSECNGNISLTGNNLLVDSFQCNLNTNHFIVNITGKNLNRISSKEPGKADINCNVYSPAIDLADFKVLFSQKNKVVAKTQKGGLAKTANSIDNAVESGNLFFNMRAGKITLQNFQATNVTANILFQEDDWQIQKAFLQHADGTFNLTAKVHQVSDALHQLSAQMNLQHINVKKLFYGFNNFSQTTLTSGNINGTMDSKTNITGNINSSGKLVLSTLNGQMYFSLKNAALINFEPFLNMQKYVFKKRDLKNVQFAELKDTFDIRNGDIYIHRMPIQSSALTMYIEGLYSFGDRTDISIQVPLTTLVNKPDNYKKVSKAKNDRPGPSIYLRAKDKNGQVKIGLDLFRKMRDRKYENMLNDSLDN
jgi:hypothetical protein